ncbi:MAG TPA: SUMF1/EgtB/PvdO family nonheme iron enzyme [Spirochaetales bacterium]|nr:SUMF1/EgtB/PvdO family nonheme iron enzyme [Spirochaetales bacterium]
MPAGSFQRDATATNISHQSAFRMSQHEITRAQFAAIMGTDPSNTTDSSGTSDPVQMVNWYQAIAFCNKLSLLEGLQPAYSVKIGGTTEVDWANLSFASIPTTSNADWNAATCTWTATGYRLPTEMQWMWAAMGATADRSNGYTGTGVNTTGYTKGYAGSTEVAGAQVNMRNYAWYSSNSGSKTHPVGTKTANELGIYDLSGNVWEWCWDWYATYPAGESTDYQNSTLATHRVVRGGSWVSLASNCPVAIRHNYIPYGQSIGIGFRVVRP